MSLILIVKIILFIKIYVPLIILTGYSIVGTLIDLRCIIFSSVLCTIIYVATYYMFIYNF